MIVQSAVDFIDDVKEWAKQPFRSDMDLTRWVLFTGLVVVASVLWGLVLREMKIK